MVDFYTPEQRRLYMAGYRERRMTEARERLGGRCSVCGATEALEFDHVDPSTKVKPVTQMQHASKKKFFAEVDKCQLLCRQHRLEKTIREGSLRREPGPIKHGTEYAYNRRGCRCEECCEAKRRSRKPRPLID
jgi:hypothetical protein